MLDRTAQTNIASFLLPAPVGSLARPNGMIDGIAIAIGATASQVVLAWALQRAPNVMLISGTTSIAHLEQIFRASQMRLTDEQFARISAVDIG